MLPGAILIWAYERRVGRWGIKLTDRLLRFVGASVAFHVVLAPMETRLIHAYFGEGLFAGARRLIDEPIPGPLWLAALGYLTVPLVLGSVWGEASRRSSRLARIVTGRDRPPRAWDRFFSARPVGLVRLTLKDGTRIGGWFGTDSYAAGYPEDPQDLLLEETYRLWPDGSFEVEGGRPVTLGWRMLIRWEEVQYLEFGLPEGFDEMVA